MPFTLPLIGHLSHAWFHLIKLGRLQRENGLERPATQILFQEPLLTLITCQDNWRDSPITSFFYLNGIFCSSFALISFEYELLMFLGLQAGMQKGEISPQTHQKDFILLPPQHCLLVLRASRSPQSTGSHQTRCQTIPIWYQGHWPSPLHIWWWVLSARQMSKIPFPKHSHFGSGANFSSSASLPPPIPSERDGSSQQHDTIGDKDVLPACHLNPAKLKKV